MLKKIFFGFLISIAINSMGFPQNLVPNPGFEEYNLIYHPVCGNDSFPICEFWYSPTNGTPEYFNKKSCFSNYNGVPNNIFGSQNAKEGVGYIGLYVGVSNIAGLHNDREYFQTKLLGILNQDQNYCVSFYVSLADSAQIAADKIGIYFSDSAITKIDGSNIYYLLDYTPQVENHSGNIITNKQNWTMISSEFIAHGGEQYITIGNFYDDNHTDTTWVGGAVEQGEYCAYYYIDDVSVTECLPDTTDSTDTLEMFFKVYPTLADEFLYLDYSNIAINSTRFILMDICGRKVKEVKIENATDKIAISTAGIANGLYLYRIESNGAVLYSGKILMAE